MTFNVEGTVDLIAAIVLAIANKYLPLATICAISSLLIFATPLVVFVLGSRLQLVMATP